MISEETIHLSLTSMQVIITALIIFHFATQYRRVRTPFNIGLLLFASAMLIQVVIAQSMVLSLHIVADVVELSALIIFLRILRT